MGKRIDGLDTIEACREYIAALRTKIEWLEATLDFLARPADSPRPYKVMGVDCAKAHTREDGFGVHAEFATLAEAVDDCRRRTDEQIAADLEDAENGKIDTARQIDAAIERLASSGWCFWVCCIMDPAARDAFEFRACARDRLTAAVLRRKGQALPPAWCRIDG